MQNISESLRRQREQVLADSGEELLGRNTSLLEIAIISLYNRLVNRVTLDTEQFRSGAAVLATGAFGRGVIGPGQPVPILFLKGESSSWNQNWLDEIITPMAEAGWQIDAHEGTIESLIKKAREDLAFMMSLFETRYISGNRQILENLDKALESVIDERQDELLVLLFEAVKKREHRLESPESWLEPDLERDPGTLPEIASIRSACRIASNIRSLDDAIFRGYLTRQEVDLLQQAEKLYARILGILQNLPGNRDSVIRFNDQEYLASKLGYLGRSGFQPVEAFMQYLFQTIHGVRCVSEEFWERLIETRKEGTVDDTPLEPLEEGLGVRHGKIYVQTGQYPATAGHLVHLFSVAAKYGLGFANVTRQWIQHHRNVLDASSSDPMAFTELQELIRADAPDVPVLRRFYNQGLLTSLIPELASVHGLTQHDAFHLYPVHEHHLRTVGELKKIFSGGHAGEEPELTRIAQTVGDITWVFFAGLIHDLGKSSGRDHALHGGEMVPAVARRLNMAPEESDIVQFLVAQHLLLMDSASLRDLADAEMLAHCALTIRTTEHLDMLCVLSFADLSATGPKGRERWRNTPVMALYEHIHHLLERGEPSPETISERIDHIRALVRKELADLMDNAELEAYFAQLVPRYLLSMSPGTIARHVRMQWQLQHSEEPFISEVAVSDSAVEITLLCWDAPGLLSRAAGILTLHDMNITGAQVFTMNNGMILLFFQCRTSEDRAARGEWDALKSDMGKLLHGRMALDYRIAAHASQSDYPQQPARVNPSTIKIDNESSGVFTILEVYTSDRIGLLYTISRALLELQIRISVAKITTKVDQVADVFYVKTKDGQKVTDREQIEEIRNSLMFWLDGPGAVRS